MAGFNIEIRQPYKKILGKQFYIKLEHFNLLKTEEEMFAEYGSYVNIAKAFVEEYETNLRIVEEKAKTKEVYKKEFEEWDGRC